MAKDTNQTTIALMQKDISYLVKSIDSIGIKVDALPNAYVSVKDFSEHLARFEGIQRQIITLSRIVYIGMGITFALQFGVLVFSNVFHLK